MLILGIETSCDETAAAVVEDGRILRSNIVATQYAVHRPYGGIVPELASREHLRNIVPIVRAALEEAGVTFREIDAIAVTRGPGLIGSLLVGICYAKSVAYALSRPLIGVNHHEGHIFSVVFENPPVQYPALALVVSGGDTSLFWMPEPEQYHLLGHTRDDAAGEAFDKVAKLLGLGYPGGPVIDRLARRGNPRAVRFTIPRMSGNDFDFSFSGLKTAVVRYVREQGIRPVREGEEVPEVILDLLASFQETVVRTLVQRLSRALEQYEARTLILTGGVACNSRLREEVFLLGRTMGISVYVPSPPLTTDNAAMIAAAAYPKLLRGERSGWDLTAEPGLRLHHVDARRDQRALRLKEGHG
ncbi:MAG: tRNA (adenosine(37)-N6)-threonylcarbamoyltransferase complex transferase subunit TsaD [Acidobacteriota bacterium]|nr:tRNA (adenosine(37)-N6)-threonylcarbamoyltransferase complex transferase subunit TsaD [Blastocatellia bacterium]MDW8169476.1 tRNA (adenosine(37)-N6)-threonylcarbamoyltransferase complex transferase subunit TsaD [Acidobacteriota bacterium]MDW8255750.1 tRNA (adenosine(37)-N6)-threonylcarbamoyltransferase complex transferase subunit TsaD [Acidobacteriota bacterium]